jgi:hypothetical protein
VLAATPRTPENAERLQEAREAVGAASADFEYLVDVDPARVLATVSGGVER